MRNRHIIYRTSHHDRKLKLDIWEMLIDAAMTILSLFSLNVGFYLPVFVLLLVFCITWSKDRPAIARITLHQVRFSRLFSILCR